MNTMSKPSDMTAAQNEREAFMAFVTDEATETVLREITESLLLPAEMVRRGTVREAHSYLDEVRSPSLLIIDVEGISNPLEEVVRLGEVCELGTRLIVVGDDNDVGLFRDLLGAGATYYLVKPLSKDQIMASISALEDGGTGLSALGRTGKIVSFIGARGGSGTSTIVANSSSIIAAETDRRVVMVDLDTQFGNLALMLGAEARGGLGDALSQPERIDSLFLERVTSQVADRLYVIGGEENLGDDFGDDKGSIDALLSELKTQFHYVIIDLPRNTSGLVYRTIQLSGVVVMVTDLSLAGMRDSSRLIKYIKQANPGTKVGLVVNKVGENQKAEISIAEFEKGVGQKIDIQIPYEENTVMKAANLGAPLDSDKSTVSKVIHEIAEKYIGIAQKTPKKRLFSLRRG